LLSTLQQRKLATNPTHFNNKEPVLPYTPAVYFQTKQLYRPGTPPSDSFFKKNTLFLISIICYLASLVCFDTAA